MSESDCQEKKHKTLFVGGIALISGSLRQSKLLSEIAVRAQFRESGEVLQ
jgi:hypothetical protein